MLARKGSTFRWLIQLGGPSLILIGLADNSVIPMPGSNDLATILLAAHNPALWLYYALVATIGASLGGYLTYRMARRGGKEMLESRLSKAKAEKVYHKFERWGFFAVAIPAILPPPFPIVPMLLAAGALQYPTRKFLAAVGAGRGVRYTILAFLGAHYGHWIIRLLSRYREPAIIGLIILAVLGAIIVMVRYMRGRKPQPGATPGRERQSRRAA